MIHAKAPANGLYRSDDAGATWRLVNDQNGTAWYYSQVRCDPTDPDHVVTLNANSRESHDGGKTFLPFAPGDGVHTDHHALWINPETPQQMILGTDGGLYLSWDAGRTWDHVENIVAGQFYAIAVDDAQPFYNVYGGLQDNQTWGGPSRTRNAFGPTNADWFRMHGGDGFYAVPDPLDHNLVYAEMQRAASCATTRAPGRRRTSSPCRRPASGIATTGARRFFRRATTRRRCTWRRTICSGALIAATAGRRSAPTSRAASTATSCRCAARFPTPRARPQRRHGGIQQHHDDRRIAAPRRGCSSSAPTTD